MFVFFFNLSGSAQYYKALCGLCISTWCMPKNSSGRRFLSTNRIGITTLLSAQPYVLEQRWKRTVEVRHFVCFQGISTTDENSGLFKEHFDTVHIVFKMLVAATHHSCNRGKCSRWWERGGIVNFNNTLWEADSSWELSLQYKEAEDR